MNIPSSTRNITTEAALQVLAEAAQMRQNGANIAMLCVGQPDFAPAPHIQDAAARAARDGPHGYTDPVGIASLREALAEYHEPDAGHSLDPARFIVTPGGKPTAWLAILMLAEPGAEIILPDPFFPVYETSINFNGAEAVTIPLQEKDGFALRPEALRERMSDKTRLVLVNSPANPTGAMLSDAHTREIAEIVAEFPDAYLLSDEIYSRIVFEPHRHHSFLRYDFLDAQLIYLNGFSKTYAMTGWRVGYGYWPLHLVDLATRFTTNAHSCVNGVAQVAAEAALRGSQDQVVEMTRAFRGRAAVARAALEDIPGVSCVEPAGAFYLFPRVGGGLSSVDMARRLLRERGLALAHGTAFGENGEGFLRFSVAASEAEIMDGVGRLAAFLADLG